MANFILFLALFVVSVNAGNSLLSIANEVDYRTTQCAKDSRKGLVCLKCDAELMGMGMTKIEVNACVHIKKNRASVVVKAMGNEVFSREEDFDKLFTEGFSYDVHPHMPGPVRNLGPIVLKAGYAEFLNDELDLKVCLGADTEMFGEVDIKCPVLPVGKLGEKYAKKYLKPALKAVMKVPLLGEFLRPAHWEKVKSEGKGAQMETMLKMAMPMIMQMMQG